MFTCQSPIPVRNYHNSSFQLRHFHFRYWTWKQVYVAQWRDYRYYRRAVQCADPGTALKYFSAQQWLVCNCFSRVIMQCMKIAIFSQFRLSVRLSSASVSKELDIIITHFDILVGASFCFFSSPTVVTKFRGEPNVGVLRWRR